MLKEFEILSSSTGGLVIHPLNLKTTDLNYRAFVVYDTSTGEILPDYISWKVTTTSTGNLVIANNIIYPQQVQSAFTDLDYAAFQQKNFIIITLYEYQVLSQLILRLDAVRSRYPNSFLKKFSLEELLLCGEAGLADINLYPPYTKMWWRFNQVAEEGINASPFLNDSQNGVPYYWLDLIVTGAFLNALISQGILEVDVNFSASDQGVTITYNNAEGIKGWYTTLVAEYERKRKSAKIFLQSPRAVGTFPYAAGSIFGMISSALGNVSTSGMPWWNSYAGRSG